MNSKDSTPGWYTLIDIGGVIGLVIAAIDNFAFNGEVSPIVIVALLLSATAISGFIWDWRGWVVTVSAWACVPLAHFFKHVFSLPDTLHPNTYTSILMLAVFTFVISIIGFGIGVLFRRLTKTVATEFRSRR